MYWPPAAYFFELEPLAPGAWFRLLAVTAPALAALLLADAAARRRGR